MTTFTKSSRVSEEVPALRRVSAALPVLFLLAALAGAQSRSSSTLPPYLSASVVVLSDITGDGIPEYAVSRYSQVFNAATGQFVPTNHVDLEDGATGGPIWRRSSTLVDYGRLLGTADWTGSGILELVIAVPGTGISAAGLEVVDIATATPVATLTFPASGSLVSDDHPLVIVGDDLDGDGQDEIISSLNDLEWGPCDHVFIFSPTQGLRTISGSDRSLGSDIWVTSDLDADGIRDLILSAPLWQSPTGNNPVGAVRACGSVSGNLIWQSTGTVPYGAYKISHGGLPDADGDGIAELMIETANGFEIRAGASGFLLQPVFASAFGLNLIWSDLHRVPDRDGDGVDDFVVFGLDATSALTMALLSAADLRPIDYRSLGATGASYAYDAAALPDTNGDGSPEILISVNSVALGWGVYQRHELAPCLSALGDGSPNHDLLSIDGSSWLPSRRCDRTIGQPFTISVDADPTTGQSTDFILWGLIGVPNASSAFTVQGGATFLFPPRIAAPSLPWLFCLADSVGFDLTSVFITPPAPWSIGAPFGLPSAIDITLQGVTISGGNIDITNGVLIHVR
ncbi:MAG: hypothetical protein H6807_13230 [Planctomycetes bacterium]|nr:hypothetical protein [Planctomycetota bacterium]